MSEETLEDMLNNAEPPDPEVEEPVAEAEAGEAAPEPEAEVEAKEPETPQEAETPEAKQDGEEPETWTKAAVLDERRKRQELERKLAELESTKDEEKPQRPDVFADPDGAFGHVEQTLRQEFSMELARTRLEISQDAMRLTHDDYDDAEAKFVEMAQSDHELVNRLYSEKSPARFVYEYVKGKEAAQKAQELAGQLPELQKQVEEQKALLEELQSKQAQKREALTPSLAATQSKGGIDDAVDESLEAIIGR